MDIKLEKAIGAILGKRGWTLATAESCTGGLISDRMTDVPGSSNYFEGGIVTYSIEAKAKHLRIPVDYIKKYGVVSPQVARRMAQGVRGAFRTTMGLSITGVAGPAGGTPETPVGTVFIAIAAEKRSSVRKGDLKGSRRKIKEAAAEMSLRFLYDHLKEYESEKR
jgi:nicotinamide-nucleotide amidase